MTELKECYLVWHNALVYCKRPNRYTLGVRIDNLFTELLESALIAQYAKRGEKLTILQELSRKLDILKYFITILWEAKGLDTNKYAQLSQKLGTTGRMLGKWIQHITPDAP